MKIKCLQTSVASGSKTYPIYVGFMRADDISRIADAPSFLPQTKHQEIARNIKTDPVRDWQRPIDKARTSQIAQAFNDTGRLMPNPVLLAANAFVHGAISMDVDAVGTASIPSGTMTISVEVPNQNAEKPLWILDGQHRISGLTESLQAGNEIPVVLLLDLDGGVYSGSLLAELFAQVTTKAEQLDELHTEWLTYAFKLGRYEMGPGGSETADRYAFDVAVQLCENQQLDYKPNPFFNAVAFNWHAQKPNGATPVHGGFSYTCRDLQELVAKAYFKQRPASSAKHLAPIDVATEIAKAYSALYPMVQDAADSVFFGTPDKQQRVMQDAFLQAVLGKLLAKGSGTNWRKLFEELAFPKTDWDFDEWVVPGGLSGPSNTASKKAAVATLTECFTSAQLPPGTSDLASYLRGDGAFVTLEFAPETPSGALSRAAGTKTSLVAQSGGRKSQRMSQTPYMRCSGQSSNVGKMVVWDQTNPPIQTNLLRKWTKYPDAHTLPWNFTVEMFFYGGIRSHAEITLKA
jgi:DGQHR domain-containing protein